MIFYLGNLWLFTSLFFISVLICYEYHISLYEKKFPSSFYFNIFLIFIFYFITYFKLYNSYFYLQTIFIIFSLLFGVVCLIELFSKKIFFNQNPIFHFLKVIYISCCLPILFYFIRVHDNGLFLLIFIVLNLSFNDTFAYFTGKLMGKRSLSSISPNKTIEGSLGGIFSALILSIIISFYSSYSWIFLASCSVLLSITGQFGDIYESLIKRTTNKKDSSQLLPGHGGILDRLDSYIFSLPLICFIIFKLI